MLPLPTFSLGGKKSTAENPPQTNGTRLAFWRYFFAPAHTRNVDFESHYKSATEQTKLNLTTLSQARKHMMETMKEAVTYPMDLKTIDALDKYASYLFPFVQTLHSEGHQPPKQPTFTWSGCLCNKAAMPFYDVKQYQFEAVMVLMNMAYLRANAAADLLETTKSDEVPDDVAKDAAKYMQAAAGIFEFITNCEWCTVPNPPNSRPSEIFTPVARCMMNVSLAEAQQCGIRVAASNGTSAGLIAKLCVNVSMKYEMALTALKDLPSSDMDGVAEALRKYIVLKAQMYRALTYKYLGKHAWDKDEKYGYGLSCMTASLSTLQQSVQATPLSGPLSRFVKEFETEMREVNDLYKQYKRDNECIYAERQVDLLSIQIPESKSSVRPTPFSLPLKEGFAFELARK